LPQLGNLPFVGLTNLFECLLLSFEFVGKLTKLLTDLGTGIDRLAQSMFASFHLALQ